jgi:hypothetical protein
MIHSLEPPSAETKDHRREDHPLRFILTHCAALLQSVSAKRLDDEGFSRQIGNVPPSSSLAALSHGVFIPRVGRAYRMSAAFRPAQAFPRSVGTSAGISRLQGFVRRCIRTQNTATYTEPGSNSLVGRTVTKARGREANR